MRAPRRRAGARELSRTLQLLIAEETKRSPGDSPTELRARAQQRLDELLTIDPAVTEAVARLKPSSSAPDTHGLRARAALAAAISQPAVAAVLPRYALTPQRRGPISDLSAVVAVLCEIATPPAATCVPPSPP